MREHTHVTPKLGRLWQEDLEIWAQLDYTIRTRKTKN